LRDIFSFSNTAAQLVTPFLNQRQAVDSPKHSMKRIKSQISPASVRRKAIFFDDARR
jgi:hypothetical protein